MKVGIDAISFYSSQYYFDLKALATARNTPQDRYFKSLGQRKMAVPPPSEDVVTLAANAAYQVMPHVDKSQIDTVLFATESGIDQSKAAGIYVHDLLGLPKSCRILELKQACYSATGAMQLILPYLKANPDKKALLIASDIARYGLHTTGESSQGCGAVAMVLSANPRVLAIEEEFGVTTENVMDFWRPNYCDTAFVEGKYSSKLYMQMLERAWNQYAKKSGRGFGDHDYFCYHVPVPRLVESAHKFLGKINDISDYSDDSIQSTLTYGREVGNCYTASMYIGLTSLLDTAANLANKRIGFYSYGSGCVAEFFSGVVQEGYENFIPTQKHQAFLHDREALNYDDYEALFTFQLPRDGSSLKLPLHKSGPFRLAEVKDHKRFYEAAQCE